MKREESVVQYNCTVCLQPMYRYVPGTRGTGLTPRSLTPRSGSGVCSLCRLWLLAGVEGSCSGSSLPGPAVVCKKKNRETGINRIPGYNIELKPENLRRGGIFRYLNHK